MPYGVKFNSDSPKVYKSASEKDDSFVQIKYYVSVVVSNKLEITQGESG